MRILYIPGSVLFALTSLLGIAVFATVMMPSKWPSIVAATALLLFGVQVVTLTVSDRIVSYMRRSLLLPGRTIAVDRGKFAVRARADGDRPNYVEILGTRMEEAIERAAPYPPAFECDNPRLIAGWIATVIAPVEAARLAPVPTRAMNEDLPAARVVHLARGGRS